MRLSLSKPLEPLKLAAENQIDHMAEKCRGKYITLGAGQAMVYAEKEREAELVAANPNVNPNLVPHLAQEAEIAGVDLLTAATVVLIMANEWRTISSKIEKKRLGAKRMVGAATNPIEIEELVKEAQKLFDSL